MVDLGAQFCERCGRDRDTVTSGRAAYRDCPRCGAACCPDCWNLVDRGCLRCAPFRLIDSPAARWVVAMPALVEGARPAADPYRDLRADLPPAPKPSAAPPRPARPRRRAGRIAIAAGAAWIVVAGLAVAALGASPGPATGPAPAMVETR
jgi:hypothetical protein